MRHENAALIGVPCGIRTMIVAIGVASAGLQWFRHNFARFPATRVHRTPGGYNLLYRMPLPPIPVLHCSYGKLGRGVDVVAEGGSILWPGPPPYGDATPGCEVTFAAPIARLAGWIIQRLTKEPLPKPPPAYRPPRRGIDEIRDQLAAYVKYSRQGTRADVAFTAACRAGRLVGQGALGEVEAVELVTGAAVEAGLAPDVARTAARNGVKVGSERIPS
jgi:hypothetical protein